MNLPDEIREDISEFIEMMAEEEVDVRALDSGRLGKDDLLLRLQPVYVG